MTYNRIAAAVLATALVGVASANVGSLGYYRREGMVRPLVVGASTTEGTNESFRELFLNYSWDNDDNTGFGGTFHYGMAPNGFASSRGAFSFVVAYDMIEPDGGDEFSQLTLQADYQINGMDDQFQYGLTAGWQDLEDVGSLTAFGFFLGKTFVPTEEGGSPFDVSLAGTQQSVSLDGGGDVDDWVWNFGVGTNLQGGVRIDGDWQTDSDIGDTTWFLRAAFPVNAMRTQTVRLAIGKDSTFRAEYGFKF